MDSIKNNFSNDEINNLNPQAPWLNAKGHGLSDKELKEVSQHWDQETWNKYLDSLDHGLSEQQLNPYDYDDIAEKMEFSCWEFSQSDADDQSKHLIKKICKKLSPQQKKIIEMTFWHGRSERFIAKELKISRNTIKTFKKRALLQIKALLEKQVSPVSPLMRGENKLSLVQGDKDDTQYFKRSRAS